MRERIQTSDTTHKPRLAKGRFEPAQSCIKRVARGADPRVFCIQEGLESCIVSAWKLIFALGKSLL
jgi:hypothetical protein